MAMRVDEPAVTQEVQARVDQEIAGLEYRIRADWLTPSGRQRTSPMYQVTISNDFLGNSRVVKGQHALQVIEKATQQIQKWAEQEIRGRTTQAAEHASEQARKHLESLRGILSATLDVDDRINWNELIDRRQMPGFSFRPVPARQPPPPEPVLPKQPFLSRLIPSMRRKWEGQCAQIRQQHQQLLAAMEQRFVYETNTWQVELDNARQEYQRQHAAFVETQKKHNQAVADYQRRFEAGEPAMVVEYVKEVFERSEYPEGFFLEHSVGYDPPAKTLVVDLMLPAQDSIPDIVEYRFVARTNEKKPVQMKKKEHDELYDDIVKQVVIRTIHEVFESVYTSHVMSVVVNGWLTYIDKATGNDVTSCIISVSAEREQFESFNLARIDHSECIKALKGITAGPLSNVAPVKPIMQLDRKDDRFIESKEVLAEIGSTTNLAEIPWEDFEHLVRDLFEKMFAGEGVEVRVTRASRDLGVDAIVFDPDPIRGGKFVIQAKRYTKAVGVGAVRELYGTMINEGAVKGILVTTAHFGRDSRAFVKDKPITLIDGPNLVYLLEQQGHKVRIDIEAARAKRGA